LHGEWRLSGWWNVPGNGLGSLVVLDRHERQWNSLSHHLHRAGEREQQPHFHYVSVGLRPSIRRVQFHWRANRGQRFPEPNRDSFNHAYGYGNTDGDIDRNGVADEYAHQYSD